MNNEYTFKMVLGIAAFCGAIAGYFGGMGWAIGIGIVMFLVGLQMMWDERKANSEKQAKNSSSSNQQKSSTTPAKISRPKSSMDTINFEYRTAEGVEGNYTVQVYKGITGNIHGWCDEREDTREFRIDRIKNDSITRIETGEVMTVKEWRKLMRENNARNRAKAS